MRSERKSQRGHLSRQVLNLGKQWLYLLKQEVREGSRFLTPVLPFCLNICLCVCVGKTWFVWFYAAKI